jgi:hypothetical protein
VTESTFSFGALALEDEPAGAVALELLAAAGSAVPVIVTLWPTCAASLLSSLSSRYELAGLLALADPEVPVGDEAAPLAGVTFVRMNLIESAAPAVPDVPTAASAFATHPVIVTLSLLEL